MFNQHQPPQMPFVESAHQGGKQTPKVILLNVSFTTSDKGAALGLAQRWHSADAPARTGHYTVDECSRYRCTDDDVIAGTGVLRSKGVIRVTMCAEPYSPKQFWDYTQHEAVLRQTAHLVAELTMAYGIPTRILDDEGQRRWSKLRIKRRGGIIVDTPGDFPIRSFLINVQAAQVSKEFFTKG